MKITKGQLKQIIKEEITKVLRERTTPSELEPWQTTLTTPAGKRHTLIITDIEEYDDATGYMTYKIDDREFDWEYPSGWSPEFAGVDILERLGLDVDDDTTDALWDDLIKWLYVQAGYA